MKSKFFHRITLLFVFIALLMGCNSCKNCQKEYEQLSQTEFHSLDDAMTATNEFLSKYDGKKKCLEYCDKVIQMREEFNTINKKFSDIESALTPKDQYCSFISMVNSNKNTFSNSSFYAVKKTWEYLVAEKKDTYMRNRLYSIDEDEFMAELESYAVSEVKRWYPKFKVVDSYVLNGRMEEMSVVEERGKLAMDGACIVHINMKGDRVSWAGDWIPRQTGSVEVWVEGTIRLSDSNCNVKFSRGEVEMLEGKNNMPELPKIKVRFHGVEVEVDRRGVKGSHPQNNEF